MSADRSDRRNSIGFLRVLFAAMVVYMHSYVLGGFGDEWFSHFTHDAFNVSRFAVQGFFVLSGALIARSWIRSPNLPTFLWHRLLRLAPALWVCLAVTAFVLTPLLYWSTPGPRTPFLSITPSAWGYVWHNLVMPRTQIGVGIYPNGIPWAGDWNGSLWTLFYEGACYLMIATLGVMGCLTRWRWLGGTALIGFVAIYSLWALPALHLTQLSLLTRLFDNGGKELTVHFLAGAVWGLFPEYGSRLLSRRWSGPLLGGLLIASFATNAHAALSPWLLPPVLFWLATVLPFKNFEKSVGGDYSYGIYIYGYPIQQTLAHFNLHQVGLYPYFLLSLILAGLCGFVSWKLVERPMLSLKNIFSNSARVSAPT
jgi:peptidoglycan/LPS O-acetylase OafA/YrhL